VERFGLFTIIVLAESIVGAVAGVAEARHRGAGAWIAAALGLFLAFLLWSLYFDMTSEQETKPGYRNLQALIFLHFPLLAALSMVGACVKALIARAGRPLPPHLPWLFCLSLAVILLAIVGLTRIMREEEEDRSYILPVARVLILCALALAGAAPFGRALGASGLMGLAAAILAVPMVIGIRAWVRYRFTLPDTGRASAAPPEIPRPDETPALRE
jgi:low temperature requirement protein LtrA